MQHGARGSRTAKPCVSPSSKKEGTGTNPNLELGPVPCLKMLIGCQTLIPERNTDLALNASLPK